MRLFGILLKKELKSFRGTQKNIIGGIIGILTVAAVMAAFVYLFIALNTRFGALGISEEILSLFTCAIIIFSVIFSLNKAAVSVFSVTDAGVTRPLPLDPRAVVLSKIVALAIYELITVSALLLPVYISYGITGGAGVGFYFRAMVSIIISAVPVTAASVLIAPLFDKIKTFLLNHGLLFFVLSLIGVGLLFFGYKYVLDLIIGLIRDRRLQFIFNTSTVGAIRTAAKWTALSSSLAMFAAGSNYWRIWICFVISALVAAGGYFLCVKLYGGIGEARPAKVKEGKNARRSVAAALIFKEVNELVRTPGYMFSYLSIALSLPALTYLTMSVLREVVSQLLTAAFVAPFSLMVLALYSTVANTFGGDALSREGNKLSIVKTIPVSYKLQMGIKLGLALTVAFVAVLITAVVLIGVGTLSAAEGILIFLIVLFSSFASIISMLNCDLGGMDPEKNTAMSVIKSFFYSIFLGAIVCGLQVWLADAGGLLIYVFPLALSALYLALVAVRYFKTMEQRIKLL